MPDKRFFTTAEPLDLNEAAQLCGGTVVADSQIDRQVARVCGVEDKHREGAAMFVGDAKFLGDLASNPPAVCLVPEKLLEAARAADLHQSCGLISCANVRASFALLSGAMHVSLADLPETAGTGEAPVIGAGCQIHDSVVIGAGAEIGSGVTIGANTVIGPGVCLGDGCRIGPNVTISHAILGARCQVLAGARLGEAGFGFVMHDDSQLRVPQLGRVILGTEVEIGANTTIDRGALADTRIGDFSKIDNLVQIGHNVVIGKKCAIAAMCGISGSCTIGDGALLGGQVGVGDHLTIGAGAIVYACAALMKDVPPGEVWAGYPAKQARQWFKDVAALNKLNKKKS